MIVIELISYKGRPVEGAERAQFDAAGGTIGRARDSTLLLPDPRRIISRTHATIEFQDGHFLLRDQGTAVPVVVNGRPVGRGNARAIAHGDELQIGDCTLRVTEPMVLDRDASADEPTILLEGAGVRPLSEEGAAVPRGVIATVAVADQGHDGGEPGPPAHASIAPGRGAEQAGAAMSPAVGSVGHEDVLLAALLRGAGVRDLQVPGGLTPRLMEDIGTVMRETIRGLRDLLAARAQAKHEVHADATVELPRYNNPLKFAPGLDAAIAQMLAPREQLFMPPLESLADAHESLRSHHEGFVAGMRAALAGVLARFDPAQLEQQLAEGEGRVSVLAMTHKARLWSLYETLYREMSQEAESDFHGLFGEDFLQAYEALARPRATPARPDDTT